MPSKSADESQSETGMLARRVFAAPPPWWLAGPIGLIALLGAVLVSLPDLAVEEVLWAFLALAAPIYVSAVLTYPVAVGLGGRTYLRRTTLQAFVDSLLVFAFVAVISLAELVNVAANGSLFDYPRARVLYLGFAATAWLRHLVWTTTSDHRLSRSVFSTAITPFLGFLAVWLAFPTTLEDDVLFFLFFVVFLLAGVAFTAGANRPMKDAFGIEGTRLVRQFLDNMTDAGETSRRELESFFDSFAQPAEVRVGVLAFRNPQGIRALAVVSHAHPGPFGTIAGSDLPTKLRTALADVCPVVLMPHGPSTHDHNPSTSAECAKVAAAAREILGTAKPMTGGSRFARANVGRATATAQLFGDVAFVTSSLAPEPTDDLDAATGFAAIHAAKDAGARDALFVDAHNSLSRESGFVHFGDANSLQIVEAVHKATLAAMGKTATCVRVGFAEGPVGTVREGIGAQGLQVLAVEADGQRVAYLLFDGNNMVPGLRDEVLAAVREVVDEAEVLTTDNHSVNTRMGGYNPIGLQVDRARVVSASRELVGKALADVRPVESLAASGTVHGLRVFGHENTTRLTTSINATVSVLRPMAVLTLGFALAVALVLLVLV